MGKKKESYILNVKLVEESIKIVLPAIKNAMETGVLKRKHLSICVLNPKNESVLFQHNIGDRAKWEDPFNELAKSKARIAKREKKDVSYVRERKPWMLESGDTIWSGGVYFQGLVVGVSGVEEYFDEMIAKWIIHTIKALCIAKFLKEKELMEKHTVYFLPEV